MSNITLKVCSSGLSKDESNKVKELISKQKSIEFLDEDICLPSKCTHLVTKTLPELKKTEKVLSALAKGIPIIDFKYVKKIVSSSNINKWNEEEYDIGGKYLTNGQMLPKLKIREHRSKPRSPGLFSNWGKIALFLPSNKACVYLRILNEGGATDVTTLSMPFQKKNLFSGFEEIETIKFSYILSEPSLVESDQNFRYFVRSSSLSDLKICSYLYVIECLCKEFPTKPEAFRLDRKTSTLLHRHQENLIWQKQSKLTQYFSKPSNQLHVEKAERDVSTFKSTPVKAERCYKDTEGHGSIDVSRIRDQRENSSKSTETPKRPRIIETIELDCEPFRPSRQCSRQNKRRRHTEVIEIDITPPPKQKHLKESIDDLNCVTGENTYISDKRTPKIKRCRSTTIPYDSEKPQHLDIISPVRRIETYPASPNSMKLRRLIRKINFDRQSEVLLDMNNCRDHCRRGHNSKQSFLSDSDTNTSSRRNSNESILGSDELQRATEYVKMQKLFGLLNAWEWCGKNIKYFLGSSYRSLCVSNEIEDSPWELIQHEHETMSYETFFETYTSGINRGFYTTSDESLELWISILHFLEESLPSNHYPSIAINRSILVHGLRNHSNEAIRIACCSYFEQLILFQFPPHTLKARQFYKSLFVQKQSMESSEFCHNELDIWEFFDELLQNVEYSLFSSQSCKTNGSILLLQIVLLILESDFTSWVTCCSHSLKLPASWPIIADIFWPNAIGSMNRRVNQILNSYISSICISCDGKRNRFPRNTFLLNSFYRRILSMIAQVADICDRNKGQNTLKHELVNSFAGPLVQQVSQLSNMLKTYVIWNQLYCLKPDWFSAAISGSIINYFYMKNCSEVKIESKSDRNGSLFPLRLTATQFDETNKILFKKSSISVSLNKGSSMASEKLKKDESNKNTYSSKINHSRLPLKLEQQALQRQRNGGFNKSELNVNKRNQYGITTRGSRTKNQHENSSSDALDLLALGGQDKLTPLADAVKSCQTNVTKRLIDYILKTGSGDLIKSLIVRKTKSGKNLTELAKDTKNKTIINLVEKFKVAANSGNHETCANTKTLDYKQCNDTMKKNQQNTSKSFDDDIHLYLAISSIYFYKYTATYRLHFTKLIMNIIRSEKRSIIETRKSDNFVNLNGKHEIELSDKRENNLNTLLAEFPFVRSPDTTATDIRTFWKLCKSNPSANPALLSIELL